MTNTACYVVLTNENGPTVKNRIDVYAGTGMVTAFKNMMSAHFDYDDVTATKDNIEAYILCEHLLDPRITILPMMNWGDLVSQTARPEYLAIRKKVMEIVGK